jgi:putative restriction endonuclease
LFLETHLAWKFMGVFSVSEIQERCVVLNRGYVGMRAEMAIFRGEMTYHEGGKRFVSHLMAERNAAVVNAAKQKNEWVCEICDLKFEDRYGVSYIEGHHKIPISTYSSTHVVRSEDIALLCPNCHRAVHILMRREELSYRQIREILRVNE